MKRIMTLIVIVSLSGALFAMGPQGNRDRGPRDGKGTMQNIVRDLNLSKEQLQKVEHLRQEQDKEGLRMGKDLRSRHQALRKELSKGDIDDQKVKEIINRLTDDQRKVLQQHVKYAKEYKKILTPEQQKKLNDHIDQMENERLTRRAGAGLLGGYNGPQRR